MIELLLNELLSTFPFHFLAYIPSLYSQVFFPYFSRDF